MERREILRHVDHTLLAQTAASEEMKRLCDEAVHYHTASVCIPPVFVPEVRQYVGDRMKVCTVIGFPNGYSTTECKAFETREALANGADEIDMVIHVGAVKEEKDSLVVREIHRLKKICGSHVLKVIVETCFLTEEEKIRMCHAVTEAGADYIKTSTGFGGGGATFEDVALFAENIGPGVRIKAAGGISSFADAERFLALGADRLGTSRLVRIAMREDGWAPGEQEQRGSEDA